ncbi:MAG: hypothetical protein ACRD2O_13745, partial [Terriglobia bacterium]
PTVSQFESRIHGILESPIRIPRGTTLKIRLGMEPTRPGETLAVEARTAGTVFPSSDLVIPDGSSLAGEARWLQHGWRIHWTGLTIRGQKAQFAAVSNLAAGTPWHGAVLNVIAE